MIYLHNHYLCPDDRQAKEPQPDQHPKMLGKLSNPIGLRKDEPEIDDKEDKLGVVMFFGGIWWRMGGFLSREWKTIEERKKQELLGEDPHESSSVFIENLQETASDSEKAFLKLNPGVVGERLPSDYLPTYNSFEIYDEDDEEEE